MPKVIGKKPQNVKIIPNHLKIFRSVYDSFWFRASNKFKILDQITEMNCPQKGPYYRDRAYRDLFGVSGPYLYFRVPIFSVWFRVTLLAIFDFSYAYTSNFINHIFGSIFWLLGVPIGSLFHKKLGPYFKAWGSL